MIGKTIAAAAAVLLASAVFARAVEMKTDAASCRVELDGARILSFRTHGGEVLWNDDPPQIGAPDWAHGGIPLCWPNFGIDSTGAIHGSAWRRTFSLRRLSEGALRSEMVLELKHGDVMLEYTVTLTDALTLEMTTENPGAKDFSCSFGFHPYFLVGERDLCSVDGVDGLSFEDDPSVANPERGIWHGQAGLASAIDRIFALPDGKRRRFTLRDRARKRDVVIESEGATHVNVWNPGAPKRCPGKIPGDAWRRFACVEPIVIGGASSPAPKLPPRGSRTLKMTVRVETRDKE